MHDPEAPRADGRGGPAGRSEPLSVSPDGVLTERVSIGGDDVIVRYDDIPACDRTTIRGIPCTTALRTVIDLAPELDAAELRSMVDQFLSRRLFTMDDAWARLAQPDMADRSGAAILRRHLQERC